MKLMNCALYVIVIFLAGNIVFLHGSEPQSPWQDDLYSPATSTRLTVELVQNGGCEQTLIGGNIPHWVEVIGTGWTQRQSNPSPWEGSHYFFAGAGANAELKQDVDVSAFVDLIDQGAQSFEFTGYVRSWEQSPADLSQIIIQYLNHDQSEILSTFDSGTYANTTYWQLISHDAIAPIGTRYIRIRLISTRRSGTNNDGYFDGLSLKTVLPQPIAPLNPEIARSGETITLDWDPVSTDTFGNPMTVNSYQVYSGGAPDFVCDAGSLIATVPTPGLVLEDWTGTIDRAFFKIIAVGSGTGR